MRTSKFSPEQMGMALRQAEGGMPIDEICRKLWVSEANWGASASPRCGS
jgi:hypothetical protein